MRISITQEVIDSSRWKPLLEIVVDLALCERHAIDPDTIDLLVDSDWVRGASRELGDILKAMQKGLSHRALSKSVVEICPKASTNGERISFNWTRIHPFAVLPFLFTPFQVVLENEEFDGAFLLWMARALNKPSFINAYRSGKFAFRHAGGKGSIDRSVRLLCSGVWGRADKKYEKAMSMWIGVVIDSDAKYPGHSPNQQIYDDVNPRVMFFHILRNRSIESYIPKRYVLQKVGIAGKKRVDAFFAMTDDQRRHYHMKVGFKIDGGVVSKAEFETSGKVAEKTKALYAPLADVPWRDLADGFGSALSSVFVDENSRPDGSGCVNEIEVPAREELEALIDMITECS